MPFSIEDITERKRAQQAEREQRMLAQALRDAAADLSRTLRTNDVLDQILKHINRVMPPHVSTGILLMEDERFARVVRYQRYTGSTYDTIPTSSRIDFTQVPNFVHMRETGQPVTIPSTEADPNWRNDIATTRWIKSYIGAPISAEGSVIGFINMASDEAYTFEEDHTNRLMAFANQVGIAIRNAQLYETVERQAEELRKRVEDRTAELEHERIRLTAILNSITDGVIFYDADNRPIYINRALARLTGYTSEEWADSLFRTRFLTLTPEEVEIMEQTAEERLRRYGLWRGEVRVRRKDGSEFDAMLITSRVNRSDGSRLGLVTVLRDISHEKQLELQRTRFIANASHELRTPIANMKTRLYLVQRQPDKLDKHLEIMEAVTDRMQNLVENLLDVSRFENGVIALARQKRSIQELIRDVVRLQQPEAERKQITLACIMEERPLYVFVDVQRIVQVITNLVVNAINYTPEGGSIQVTVERDKNFALILVEDTGIGISPDLLPHIFKPFFRGNDQYKGTGLGLSIAREIVNLHGGHITVDSVEGSGSIFSVRLALVDADATPDTVLMG